MSDFAEVMLPPKAGLQYAVNLGLYSLLEKSCATYSSDSPMFDNVRRYPEIRDEKSDRLALESAFGCMNVPSKV